MKIGLHACYAAGLLAFSMPAAADVIESDEDHFVTRDEVVVDADPKATWLALISPARWWSSEHTWSADAANLTLTPQAGGCFCERIPESDEPGRITLEGSVEHMRVIQAYPEVALRMEGALGPLQSEPVTGILTIALTEVDDGTRIVWEYNVGGKMRYELPIISRAVDGVMSQQLSGLADLLGRVEEPEEELAPEAVEEDVVDEEIEAEAEEPSNDVSGGEADADDAETPTTDGADEAAGERGPSVDEAFDDLVDDE